jgi:hypothetical protein
MGTVRYMSPEQVRGQEVDHRTDLYSLGATLYESLIGDTPFDGSTHFEIMTQHLSELPVRPSQRAVTLPAAVEDAVMRSLAKRADDRFGSAREMRKQLEGALRDADLGLVETQRLDRDVLGELRATSTPVGLPTARLAGLESSGRRAPATGSLADALEPDTGAAPRRRRLPWLAIALAMLIGGGGAAAVVLLQHGRPRATIAIAGVSLTRSQAVGKLLVETDGTIEPDELARLYRSTLDTLRAYVQTHLSGPAKGAGGTDAAAAITEPVDVLLGVPAHALCEPTAYLDGQPPKDCATQVSATAIGAQGTHRLMVVSDRARLVSALRKGVAQAACEFSPLEDTKRVSEICDITSRFAESAN